MNPYINDNLDISLLSDQDKKEILVWADECTQGYILIEHTMKWKGVQHQ